MKIIYAFASLFLFCFSVLWGQNCPKIERTGNQLRVAEPAGGTYQWFLNGNPIPNATSQTLNATTNGDYTVEVYGFADPFAQNLPTFNVKVSGQTLDRLLQPVAGVTVSMGGQTVTSDAAGRFVFPETAVNRGRFTLKYEKAGYFPAGQGLNAYQNGQMKTVVCLVDKGAPLTFQTADGLTATARAARVEIPAGSLKTANGQPYNGEVRAYVAAFNPDDPMYGETMPGGDLLARNGGNQQVMLQSLGILNVEMETPSGERLQLADGAEATLSFRAPKMYKDLAASKDEIPLWHFDESAQLWREEGVSVKQPNGWFEGKVKHFSWWNCDVPMELSYVKGCVTNSCTGQPAAFTPVYFNEASLITDSAGCFFNWIPANQIFKVYANEDTVTITTPNVGDTLVVLGLQSNLNVFGYGLAQYDSSGLKTTVIISSSDSLLLLNIVYSIDGQNFQTSNIFKNLTSMPSNIWVKDDSCLKKMNVYFIQQFGICPLLSQQDLNLQPCYYSFESALIAQSLGNAVFNLSLAEKPIDVQLLFEHSEACPCLQAVNLSKNHLTVLNPKIENFSNLETLYLEENLLSGLPPQIGNLTNLKHFSLQKNEITSLPNEIGFLTNLENLFLYQNKLSELPVSIGNLTKLKIFHLMLNQLTSLPTSIGNLVNLKELNIEGNLLTNFPIEITYLDSLVSLNIGDNDLSSIPSDVENFSSLLVFTISANHLSILPPEIGNLNNLEALFLDFNQLTSLPSEIGNLSKLSSLGLYENQLTSFPPEICNLKDTLSSFGLQITNNPGSAAMQAQWDACP